MCKSAHAEYGCLCYSCLCACVFPAQSHRRPSFATSKYLPIILGVWIHLHLKPTEGGRERRREKESKRGEKTRHKDKMRKTLTVCNIKCDLKCLETVCVFVCVCLEEQADMIHFPDCLFCLFPPLPLSLSSSLSLPLSPSFFSFGALRKALTGMPKYTLTSAVH